MQRSQIEIYDLRQQSEMSLIKAANLSHIQYCQV